MDLNVMMCMEEAAGLKAWLDDEHGYQLGAHAPCYTVPQALCSVVFCLPLSCGGLKRCC